MSKLKWRVEPCESGLSKWSHRRGWPSATVGDDITLVRIQCEDEYVPAKVKSGNHAYLIVYIALWWTAEERGDRAAFNWVHSGMCKTLEEAKKTVAKILKDNPDYIQRALDMNRGG